ncbi:MAG: argininosuccinate synthase [Acidobacteriota bacterium]
MVTNEKVVLAYSGGLDTSIIVPWLREQHGLEVHCLVADVGQGAGELAGVEDKALASGAASCEVVDLRERMLVDCAWPCLRALSIYERRYLLGTSLARPVIAEAQVAHARRIGASAVAHGCTGRGNDQVRFELAYQALAPDLTIVAPWREWSIRSREDAIDYAAEAGIPVDVSKTKIYSRDRNLWHLSHEGGPLEDPGSAAPDDLFLLTVDPRDAPDEGVEIELGFEAGVPVSLNGTTLGPVELVETLNELAGQHGVGRADLVENRLVGMKSRGVYETPAGTVLLEALTSLRALTLERDTARQAERLAIEHAELVYTGRWFHPLREALDLFFAKVTETVTGTVQLRLYKGSVTPLSTTSPCSLFDESLATFEESDAFDHADATGFLRIYGLPGRVAARVRSEQAATTGVS